MNIMLTGITYWLWLTERLDNAAAWRVYRHFGSPERAYFSDPAEYELVEGLEAAQRRLLRDKSTSEAERILARCDRQSIRLLTYTDTDYPERLRNIEVPPLVLYLRGRPLRFDERAVIAFAGTRRCTPYGAKVAFDFAGEVTSSGGIVATGVVDGCDASAAAGALRAGGPLCLVTAGGVDVPYYDSERSRALLDDAAAVGCVLSEAPPGTKHLGALFRRRNVILCGLACGVFCVEAPRRSGTLMVAAIAAEQGKEVYTVPANLGAEASSGTNDLLGRRLAVPVLSGRDLLADYAYLLPGGAGQAPSGWRVVTIPARPAEQTPPPAPAPESVPEPAAETRDTEKRVDSAAGSRYIELLDAFAHLTEEERTLLRALAAGPATTESLIAATGLGAATVSAVLTLLAVNGTVRECSGGRFELIPEALV